MIKRFLQSKLEKSPKSILLLGPRQVGKSTLLNTLKPDLTINLAQPAEYLAFSQNPSELEERIGSKNPGLVLIDEIQRIPDLLNSIQVMIDNRRPKIKFLLSGSSARKLKRGSANLLPGRLFTYRMGALSCAELGYQMNTNRALELGCLPEPHFMDQANGEKLLRSYTSTYLQEEILQETMIRQIQGFSRFFSVVAKNAGNFFDFSKMSALARVSRSAARRYFEILEDTLICERVLSYENEKLDLVRHPRFFLFDVGLVNASLGNFKISEDRKGLLLEHLFYNQLKNTSFAFDLEVKISHFRTRGGLEVDFLLEVNDKLHAIEVKSTADPSERDLSAISQISKLLKREVRCYVAHAGTAEKKIKGIDVLPWQQVIREIFGSGR